MRRHGRGDLPVASEAQDWSLFGRTGTSFSRETSRSRKPFRGFCFVAAGQKAPPGLEPGTKRVIQTSCVRDTRPLRGGSVEAVGPSPTRLPCHSLVKEVSTSTKNLCKSHVTWWTGRPPGAGAAPKRPRYRGLSLSNERGARPCCLWMTKKAPPSAARCGVHDLPAELLAVLLDRLLLEDPRALVSFVSSCRNLWSFAQASVAHSQGLVQRHGHRQDTRELRVPALAAGAKGAPHP